MEPFEPPKYIASLIAAINDGAKTAQTGALAFTFVGLYLVATALSTTDEDLLLEHTTTISQLGVQLPVVVSFAIAPVVFVVLHIFTLIRYDMLSTNLQQLRFDLRSMVTVEADRERCRQLLANVEFVVAHAVPRGSPLQTSLYRWVVFSVIATFPVAVLATVQISSLRYQSAGVNLVQRVAAVIDLLLLVWFFRRQLLAGNKERDFRLSQRLRLWIGLVWIPVVAIAANVAWLNIPGPEATTVANHRGRITQVLGESLARRVWTQPLDLWLCPGLRWGCRFLTVDNRTLVGRVWNNEVIVDLRKGSGDPKSTRSAVEGVLLKHRNLRFVNLEGSRLYGADLSFADLTKAYLLDADLTNARLVGSDLTGATLLRAHLRDADLTSADLTDTILNGADLSGADLTESRGLPQSQLEVACGKSTKVPVGLNWHDKVCKAP